MADAARGRKSVIEDALMLSIVQQYFRLAGVVLLVWFVGYFAFSPSWLLLALIVYMWREKYTKTRDQMIEIAQNTAKDEKATILARVEELPSWVFFPDVERVEWCNKIIDQVWPYVGDYVDDLLHTTMESKIRDSLPETLKSFRFQKIDLGDIPPRIGGVKVYTQHVRRDEIVMDMEIIYSSDADFIINVKGFNAGIKDLQIRGTVRVVFKPLINVMPLFGGLNVYFLNSPNVDFNLTSLANALDVPGLSEMLHTIVQEQISSLMVLPNRISIAMSNKVDICRLKYPLPQGVLRIYALGASDLKKADISIMGKGKSDPYCVIKVGAQKFKTKVQNNTVNPEWREVFEAIVDEKSGQFVDVELYDEDPGSKDDQLGSVSLDILPAVEKGMIDSWLPLEDVKKGLVHIKLMWLHMSGDPLELDKILQQIEEESQDLESMSSCLLMVNLDSAQELPKVKKTLSEPSPYAVLSLGQTKFESYVKANTIEPRWEENFRFLVHDPNFQCLSAELLDKKTGKSLGRIEIPLKSLLGSTDMVLDQRFDLRGGDGTGKLSMRLTLRVLTPELSSNWIEPNLLNYAKTESDDKLDSEVPQQEQGDSIDHLPADDKLQPDNVSSDLEENRSNTQMDLRHRKSSPSLSSAGEHGRGRIQLTIRYSTQRQKLIVVIHKCSNLLPCDSSNLADPYVRMYLLPDKSSSGKRKTQIVKDSLNPIFDETFEFCVAPNELQNRTLDVSVKHNKSMFSSDRKVIGLLQIDMAQLDITKVITERFDLQPEEDISKVSIDSEV